MNSPGTTYFDQLRQSFSAFIDQQGAALDRTNCLRIDLHCHDLNSDTPDELWGRLLRLPETWLKTKTLLKQLERSGSDLFTITNHNNARSCWPLLVSREDLIVGAEFTCHFPDMDLSVHVLCYGFSQAQELELNRLRRNAYEFVRFAKQNELPLVLPHPLFFYSRYSEPTLEVLERFAVMFERFEVLNGQRGVWQNELTRHWVQSLTPEYIDACAAKHGLDPHEFCFEPYRKRMTGGSDDHNGLFAGQCGTLIEIPDLQPRLAAGEVLRDLVKEALLHGKLAPFGEPGEEEKLTTTFLDYFAQVVMHMKDPGLVRLLLHKGEISDKLACLAISNAIQELQRHRYTMKFLETFHQALHGKKPTWLVSLNTRKEFKPILKVIKAIARAKREDPTHFPEHLRILIPQLQRGLSRIFFDRLNTHLARTLHDFGRADTAVKKSLKRLEVPTHFRALVTPKPQRARNMSAINVGEVFDQLSFPALAASLVLGAGFMGTQVLYSNRPFISAVEDHLGGRKPPRRVLWLTDTLVDKNGVSTVLSQTLAAIRKRQLPIDLLTCHPTLEEGPNLRVVPPISELSLPNFDDQVLYVPDILKIQRIFEQGGYDRVICSTELLMGPVALYLKHAFATQVFFFMHTDWLAYAEARMQLSAEMQDRVRRILRSFYKGFDGVIALNDEQEQQLLSPAFELAPEQVLRSAHWPAEIFSRERRLTPILERPKRVIFVGRLSAEKGVGALPEIWQRVRQQHPDAQLILAGQGPMEAELREALPDALFTGWLSQSQLVEQYKNARCQLLPSRFDTFGCVVIEAMCLGVPTFAYDCKGPASIIQPGVTGELADTPQALAEGVISFLSDEVQQQCLSGNARSASEQWREQRILERLLDDLYRPAS